VFRKLYYDFYFETIVTVARLTDKELSGNRTSLYDAGVIYYPPVAGFVELRTLTLWQRAARRFIRLFAGKAITGITSSTLRAFKRTVRRGTDLGEGTEKISRNLAKQSKSFSTYRATLWVKTELVAASNAGSIAGARTSGLKLNKIWITSIDGRERATHNEANQQTVPLDEPFIVGGEELDVPGDPGASLKNRMRCRCAVVYEPI